MQYASSHDLVRVAAPKSILIMRKELSIESLLSEVWFNEFLKYLPKVKSTLLVFSATQLPASMNFYAFGLISQRRDLSDAIVTLTLIVVEAVYGCVNDAYQLR